MPESWPGSTLLAVVTVVSGGQAQVASLSPPVRQMIRDAAQAASWGDYAPVMPDTETVFGVLVSLVPADREVILGLLPPETGAEFEDFLNSLRSIFN